MSSQQHDATTIAGSQFLDRLPVELRLAIYKIAFSGARVLASVPKNRWAIAGTHSHDDEEVEGKYPENAGSITFSHSKHYGLLISCRQVHEEALSVYWSEAVLTFQSGAVEASRPWQCKKCISMCETNSVQLLSALPEVAKVNVKHLRGLLLPRKKADWHSIESESSNTGPRLLDGFQNLVSCEIGPTILVQAASVDLGDYHCANDFDSFSRFDVETIPFLHHLAPHRFLFLFYGIDAKAGVTFHSKVRVLSKRWTSHFPLEVEYTEVQFLNFSTNTSLHFLGDNFDEEEAYAKVLKAEHIPWGRDRVCCVGLSILNPHDEFECRSWIKTFFQ